MIVRGQLFKRNWFILDSPRCSENEAGVKIFFSLYDEKMCPVYKQSNSEPKIASYYFLKLQRLAL